MSCRKKIDSKQWTEYTQLMESEVRSLKRELEQTREALRLATKRCRELVCELDNRTAGHESERALRDQQLSRILRALLAVEGRLRQEQKSIRQLLREKDNVIRNQQLEIAKLRRYTKNYIKCKRDNNNRACNNNNNNKNNKNNNNNNNNNNHNINDSTTPKTTYDRRTDDDDDDDDEDVKVIETNVALSSDAIGRGDSLDEDMSSLKREIIDRLNDEDSGQGPHRGRGFVRKNYSFAESDVSKSSLTSGEITDLSTTTTMTTATTTTTSTTEDGDGSPSLVSTEGFCEGESDDASPGSTLNKPNNRCIVETKVVSSDEEDGRDEQLPTKRTRTRRGKTATRSSKSSSDSVDDRRGDIVTGRDDSNEEDDGMDCRFVSDEEDEEEEEEEEEPLYENSGERARLTRTNVDCVESARHRAEVSSAENVETAKVVVVNARRTENPEETSGNWYSDPDEDKAIDDVFRHRPSGPNGKHNNSVLECVNQILLRDMEEEENALLSIPRRRFKHRGRIVRFQPAKLSDIESVGSEMERKNSDQDHQRLADADPERRDQTGSSLANGICGSEGSEEVAEEAPEVDNDDDGRREPRAMEFDVERAVPIVVIEPVQGRLGEDCGSGSGREESRNGCEYGETVSAHVPIVASKMSEQMEEERTCLRMSSRGLTIPRQRLIDRDNGDDDDDDDDDDDGGGVVVVVAAASAEESRGCDSPRSPGTRDKTPPALPPRPNYRNTSLILKKIPSPSFLIDEPKTRRPTTMPSVVSDEARPRSLFFAKGSGAEESPLALRQGSSRNTNNNNNSSNNNNNNNNSNNRNHGNSNVDEERFLGFFARNSRFGDRGSPIPGFRSARRDDPTETYEGLGGMPKVTSIVRHFEEFKIGEADEADRLLLLSRRKGDSGARTRTRTRTTATSATRCRGKLADKLLPAPREGEKYDEDDIRQNFEEFRLDDCDLFNDDDAAAAAEEKGAAEESKDTEASTASDPDRPEADGSERLAVDPSALLARVTREESCALGRTRTSLGVRDVGGSVHASDALGTGYDHFLEATGLSTKSILLTPSRLLSNHKSMLKPKDVKYKNKIKATAVLERHGVAATGPSHTRVKRWTGPFV